MSAKRFVLLEHHWNGVHFDFMIESGKVLRTWKLTEPPASGQRQNAQANSDHRLIYLDYEGPISGDRGHVVRWDAGTYEILDGEAGMLRLQVEGAKLRGVVELRWVREVEWEWFYLES